MWILLRGPWAPGWGGTCPVAALRGAQELSARDVCSWSPHAEAARLWRVVVSRRRGGGSPSFWFVSSAPLGGYARAQQWLTESPRSCPLGQWAQGACMLEQCDRGDRMLAAREVQDPASAAGALRPWLGMLSPCSGSQRHRELPAQAAG